MRQEIEINSILKNFYKISGIRISIHDNECNEIYSYPGEASMFCKTLQNNTSILADCKIFPRRRKTSATILLCYEQDKGKMEKIKGFISGYLE